MKKRWLGPTTLVGFALMFAACAAPATPGPTATDDATTPPGPTLSSWPTSLPWTVSLRVE